jgi:hypothetical protein
LASGRLSLLLALEIALSLPKTFSRNQSRLYPAQMEAGAILSLPGGNGFDAEDSADADS